MKDFTSVKGNFSSACGNFQIIRKTLVSLKKELGLTGNEKFDEGLQLRMAYALLERRGYSDYLNGKIDAKTFANRLAHEWASLPRGPDNMSVYCGDGVNKAHADWNELLAVLEEEKNRYQESLNTPTINGPDESRIAFREEADQMPPQNLPDTSPRPNTDLTNNVSLTE